MAYVPPDKPLGEFTDEERDAFIAELKRRTSPEDWETLKTAASAYVETAKALSEYSESIEEIKNTLLSGEESIASVLGNLSNLIPDADSTSVASTEEIEEVALAQYQTDSSYENHSLMAKAISNGLMSLAMGEPEYKLTPKGGKSKEGYTLTGSAKHAAAFISLNGNGEILIDALETVQTLKKDPKACAFVYNGRIWFTVNTILQEMRRTAAGTVNGRDNKKQRELVNAALHAASGMQIVGTDPQGRAINTTYVLNAELRDEVKFRGKVYISVWGFPIDSWTLNDYANELGHSWNYPLLNMKKPLTIDQAWIDRYLKDLLNEARSKLYATDANNEPKKRRRTTWKVERLWDGIFELAYPAKQPNSRQKANLVKQFETVLTVLAKMDGKGELRDGMPLYITAHSERDGSRGRGKGAWVKLVIQCSSSFKAFSEGDVNLTGE